MNLSNEHLLQTHCLPSISDEYSLQQVKILLKHDLDWQEILKSANWHGIEPLLYHSLKNIPESDYIPKDIMSKLKNSFYMSAASNMAIYDELRMVLEEFRKKSIHTIVIKGAALAKTIYTNIALRPMIDIDLLVKKEQLIHAEEVLKGLGYRFHGSRSSEWYRKNNYHILYANQGKKSIIELHWHIADNSYPSKIAISNDSVIKGWWERARNVECNGQKMLILCPEDTIFLLTIHFLKHRFQSPRGGYRGVFTSRNSLIQLCDIYLTLRYYKAIFDWHNFDRELKRNVTATVVYSTLFVIRNTLGNNDDLFLSLPVTNDAMRIDKELVQLIQNRLFSRDYVFSLTPLSFIQSIADGNFQKKIRNLFSALFPQPEMISKMYSVPITSKRLYLYNLIYLLDFIKSNRKRISVALDNNEIKVINKWIGSD